MVVFRRFVLIFVWLARLELFLKLSYFIGPKIEAGCSYTSVLIKPVKRETSLMKIYF